MEIVMINRNRLSYETDTMLTTAISSVIVAAL